MKEKKKNQSDHFMTCDLGLVYYLNARYVQRVSIKVHH